MGRDVDALKPAWLRMSTPFFLDVVPWERWLLAEEMRCRCHAERSWLRWAREREERWNQMDSGDHASGVQKASANLIGALGEACYHVVTGVRAVGWRDDRKGIHGADFEDGVDVKASGRWYNPFLVVPQKQVLAPRFALAAVAVDAHEDGRARAILCWTAERNRLLELATENARYNAREFVDWYRNGIPHHVVNWSQVGVEAPRPRLELDEVREAARAEAEKEQADWKAQAFREMRKAVR